MSGPRSGMSCPPTTATYMAASTTATTTTVRKRTTRKRSCCVARCARLPEHTQLRGLRATGFIDADAYVANAARQRQVVGVTYEHPYVHAGFNYLWTTDQVAGIGARARRTRLFDLGDA